MDEQIDQTAVIIQLQLENEMLRRALGGFAEVKDAIETVPNLVQELWHKAMSNKTRLLVGLMLVYWAVSLAFLVWDRFHV